MSKDGAIYLARGTGTGLVMPRCTTEAMTLHLAEFAKTVAPGVHAVLLLDQAGWRTTHKLAVPPNITLLPLQARSPELNPVDPSTGSRRGFVAVHARQLALQPRPRSYADILDYCCDAWNTLIDRPWRIMSIGLRT